MPSQNNPQDPTVLRDSLTREVSSDAYAIAAQIFKGPQPDVSRVSNEELDARYRQAFSSNDRAYLMQEAQRDPTQFLASMDRLGVTMPPDKPITPDPPLPKEARSNVPVPKPPAAATATTYPAPEAVPAVLQPPPPGPMGPVPPMVLPPGTVPAPLAPAPGPEIPPPGVIPA